MIRIHWQTPCLPFDTLLGKTLWLVDRTTTNDDDTDALIFCTTDDEFYALYYCPDCPGSSSCTIESITGDFSDLIGRPLRIAEEAVSDEPPAGVHQEYVPESQTWTFYKLATVKGYVDIRWFGESNGYYSESVTFAKLNPKDIDEEWMQRCFKHEDCRDNAQLGRACFTQGVHQTKAVSA